MGIVTGAIVGGIAGFLAEKIMKEDHGVLMNIALGVIGGIVGNFLLSQLGVDTSDGWVASIVVATGGACILVWLYRKFQDKQVEKKRYHTLSSGGTDPLSQSDDDKTSTMR